MKYRFTNIEKAHPYLSTMDVQCVANELFNRYNGITSIYDTRLDAYIRIVKLEDILLDLTYNGVNTDEMYIYQEADRREELGLLIKPYLTSNEFLLASNTYIGRFPLAGNTISIREFSLIVKHFCNSHNIKADQKELDIFTNIIQRYFINNNIPLNINSLNNNIHLISPVRVSEIVNVIKNKTYIIETFPFVFL